jgi:hypothetical protein
MDGDGDSTFAILLNTACPTCERCPHCTTTECG